MRRFIGYIVLLTTIVIYVVSSSNTLTAKVYLYKYKSTSPVLRYDGWRYGDLFGMSYLPDFQILRDRKSEVERLPCENKKGINLYAMCDSYVWFYLPADSLYCGVDNFKFAKFNNRETINVQLDTSKINVLLLESTERNLRPILHEDYIHRFLTVSQDTSIRPKAAGQSLYTQAENFLFNKKIDKNIELNVWETALFTPFKAFKAGLNYELFDRVDEQVEVSTNRDRLYYAMTIDTTYLESAFKHISESEMQGIINELNQVYDYYKDLGFDEVYLSIIPNPVTIFEPNYRGLKHNKLIDRIQGSAKLKIPFIDVYSVYKNTSLNPYYVSDTHWNMTGAYMWLNEVNKELSSIQRKTK